MKFTANLWNQKYDGIQFFVQRLEEMLFHYSDDIVRAPVHNTQTLIVEYIDTEKAVQEGKVKPYMLPPILSELQASIEHDKILRKHFGDEFVDTIAKSISKEKGPIVRYLHHKMPQEEYYTWCKEYIAEQIVQASHKTELEFAARVWISSLIWYGYSPEYVYSFLRTTFAPPCQDPESSIEMFLDHFSFKKRNYNVYFSFSPLLAEYKELLSSRLKVNFEDDGLFKKAKGNRSDFVGYIPIESLDSYMAIKRAYTRLEIFIKFYRAISNRRKELVRKYGLVKSIEDDSTVKIPAKSKGYRVIEIEPTTNIEEDVDNLILGCQQKSSATYSTIHRIIDLHNSAIGQSNLDDGFVNLWSILEIVSDETPGDSKIEKVTKGIIPILKKAYMLSVLSNILCDLRDNLDNTEFENLANSITTTDDILCKIGHFVFLPEYEQLRDEYFIKLGSYPVIRNKIYNLYQIKESKKEIKNLMDRYSQRIEWHIYRLYRTRNSIVHAGKSHKRIQVLGEHLHIYVDRVMTEIITKISDEDTIETVRDVLIDAELLTKQTEKNFEVDGPITCDDIAVLTKCYYYKTMP